MIRLTIFLLVGISINFIFIEKVHAIPECEGIDVASVSQVKACINNMPQIEALMPQMSDGINGCQLTKLYFKSVATRGVKTAPTCEVFSQALEGINSKPPVWAVCVDHYEKGGDPSACMNKIITSMSSTRRIPTDCSNMQKMMQSISATMLDPVDVRNYQAPSCETISAALSAGSTQIATAPARPANTPAINNQNDTASNQPNPPSANVSSGEPYNQFTPVNGAGQSNVLYTFRNKPIRYTLKIDAYQDSVCAPIMDIIVSIYSADAEYSFASATGVHNDILEVLRKRCTDINDVFIKVGSDFGSASGDRKRLSSFYQGSAANNWAVRKIPNPMDAYSAAEYVSFRANSKTRGLLNYGAVTGKLRVNADTQTASGVLAMDGLPLEFDGTFQPFVHADKSEGKRVTYTIKGNWQGNGYQIKCASSKNGYSYWGTFTLEFDQLDTLRIETCPETKNANSSRFYNYRIAWQFTDQGTSTMLNNEAKIYSQFRPAAGSFLMPDPELAARKKQQRRQALLDAEKLRIKPGLVYKPYQYWQGAMGKAEYLFTGESVERAVALTLKNVFDGVFNDIDYREPHLKLIYYNYVHAFSQQCKSSIKDPIIKVIVYEETDRFGERSREESGQIFVERKFSETFENYYTWRKRWLINVGMSLATSGGNVSSMADAALFHSDVMDSVVDELQCNTASMQQFTENLWRATHNKPSLQAAGESIPGAEGESEIPPELR